MPYVEGMGRRFNPHKLLKREFVWLHSHFCKHGHNYLEHPSCYFDELPDDSPIEHRVGFLDIETSNLNADFGYMFCYSIQELGKDLIHNCITPAEIQRGSFDKNVVNKACKDMAEFDILAVYWGKDRRHDIPFLRTRALHHGLEFPLYRELYIVDVYDIVKAKLNLHRNRLADACRFFEIECKGHALIPDIWIRAQAGKKEALEHIQLHCDEDVFALRDLWVMLERFVRDSRLSI